MQEPDYDYFYCDGETYREHGVWDTKGCTIILEIWDRSKQEWIPSKPMNGEWVSDPYNGDNDGLIRKISRDEAYREITKQEIKFNNRELQQYPDCKNAEIDDKHNWQDTYDGVVHYIPMVKCKLKTIGIHKLRHPLCLSLNEKGECPDTEARLQVKIGDEPKVEVIRFPGSRTGSQYANCKHAIIDMTKHWENFVDGKTHYTPYVRCALSIPKHGQHHLCLDLNETGVCRYEFVDEKLEKFPLVKCANCLNLSSRLYLPKRSYQKREYHTGIYCRERGIPIGDDYLVERFCTEFVPCDHNETELNSIKEFWYRWTG
jgi:hypothetical protein